MNRILEELWYGNICPQEQITHDNREIKKLLALMAQNREKLCETISNEEKNTLEKYDDCVNEMNGIIEREIFIYAFSLGGRIALEMLSGLIKRNFSKNSSRKCGSSQFRIKRI